MKPLNFAAAVVVLVGAAWLGDSCVAMHAENSVAGRVHDAARLDETPSVYIGGLPYVAALWTHTIPLIEVNAMDVEVPRLGMINASTTLRDVTVTPEQVWSGDFEGAEVSTLSRAISLDGVALGRLLDMTDLSIANPNNISPSGGLSAEAELTGTIPGDTDKTTVQVDLRLSGATFTMKPTNAADDRIRDAFSLELDTRQLPLPSQATMVSLRGGQISFEVQRRNVALANGQLSPLEIDGEYDADGKQN